jgi:AbrB family looped-hinge helix DNA binding protein
MSSKNQITVPAKVRDALGLKPFDSVSFVFRNGDILVQRARASLANHYQPVPARSDLLIDGLEPELDEMMDREGEAQRLRERVSIQ